MDAFSLQINPGADLNKICMLGCGVATGWGAVFNNCKLEAQSSVVVYGLGALGLAAIQAAKVDSRRSGMRSCCRVGSDGRDGIF